MNSENYTYSMLEDDLSEVGRLTTQPNANSEDTIMEYCDAKYQPPFSDLVANALTQIILFQAKNREALEKEDLIRSAGPNRFSVNQHFTRALHRYFFLVHRDEFTDAPSFPAFLGHVNMFRPNR